jgi:hypothetical protein
MPFTHPWNEAAPLGSTTDADTIDTIFQQLKLDLRERLEQVIPNFGNNAVDPKKVKLTIDVAASRPVSGAFAGDVYVSSDTDALAIWDGSAWVDITGGSGIIVDVAANRPNPPSGPGLMFFATDTSVLSISSGTGPSVWQDVLGGGSGGGPTPSVAVTNYITANAPGTRADLVTGKIIGFVITGLTDVNGEIKVERAELAGIVWGGFLCAVATIQGDHNDTPQHTAMVKNDANNIWVTVSDGGTGALLVSTAVVVFLQIMYVA